MSRKMASKSPDRSIRSSGNASPRAAARTRDARLVFDSIRRIVRVLRLQARHTEKAFELSAAALVVLHKLAEARAQETPGELAEEALTDQRSVPVVVQRLVEPGC